MAVKRQLVAEGNRARASAEYAGGLAGAGFFLSLFRCLQFRAGKRMGNGGRRHPVGTSQAKRWGGGGGGGGGM